MFYTIDYFWYLDTLSRSLWHYNSLQKHHLKNHHRWIVIQKLQTWTNIYYIILWRFSYWSTIYDWYFRHNNNVYICSESFLNFQIYLVNLVWKRFPKHLSVIFKAKVIRYFLSSLLSSSTARDTQRIRIFRSSTISQYTSSCLHRSKKISDCAFSLQRFPEFLKLSQSRVFIVIAFCFALGLRPWWSCAGQSWQRPILITTTSKNRRFEAKWIHHSKFD